MQALPAMRFDLRQDDLGWTVFDRFTGWPAILTGMPQRGLSLYEADETAELLELLAYGRHHIEIAPPLPESKARRGGSLEPKPRRWRS